MIPSQLSMPIRCKYCSKYSFSAGFAFGWKKINALEGINGIQWHSWFDHLGDGARLGLRKYNDTEYQGEAKPVWMTYQKANPAA